MIANTTKKTCGCAREMIQASTERCIFIMPDTAADINDDGVWPHRMKGVR